MSRFNKNKAKELRQFLYNSCIHDAKLESIRYKYGADCLEIKAFNPIFNVKINLTFCDVEIVLAIRNSDSGNRETIISLTVEDDLSYLQNYIQKYSGSMEDSLYLLFQMFSGDELHIVSKEVIIEIAR